MTDPAASVSRHVRAHDPSTIIECNSKFWVFRTGPGIPSYCSTDLTNWAAGPSVFLMAPPWAAKEVPENHGIYYWAPDVIHLEDGYHLYYAISSFGKNRSAIGHATNPTLDPNDPKFKWADAGMVVQSRITNDFNAIDPAITTDEQGGLWLSFGSFWSGIKMIRLDSATGGRSSGDNTIFSLASHDKIEAPYVYRHGKYYYLFVNWGLCCRGTASTYEIRIGRSPAITGPYLDKSGRDMTMDGGTLFLKTSGNFVGPGHAGIITALGRDWLSCHFYDATQGGRGTLAVMPLRWSKDGWPETVLSPVSDEK